MPFPANSNSDFGEEEGECRNRAKRAGGKEGAGDMKANREGNPGGLAV